MTVIFSLHAKRKIEQRKLDESKVIETLQTPDFTKITYNNRQMAEKNYGKLDLRVIYINENNNITVITAHWHESRKQ